MRSTNCTVISSPNLVLGGRSVPCNPAIRTGMGRSRHTGEDAPSTCSTIYGQTAELHLFGRKVAKGRSDMGNSALEYPVQLCFCSKPLVRLDVSRLLEPLNYLDRIRISIVDS